MIDSRVYLDYSATSYIKPEKVTEALCRWCRCGNSGRGSHSISLEASEIIYKCRCELAEMFNSLPELVVFTSNATAALNIAIKGTVKYGGHIISSDFEHNSVRRPILSLVEKKECSYDIFKTDYAEYIPYNVEKLICRATAAVVSIHKSNITNRTMPVREIGEACRRHGVRFIVDASQSAGHIDIDMQRDNIDILCLAGHKGLYGPENIGVLILREPFELETVIEGGGGLDSRLEGMPEYYPDRLEAGTLSAPMIAALYEGVRFVRHIGLNTIHNREKAFFRKCRDELISLGCSVYDADFEGANLLFNLSDMSPSVVGDELDRRGICVRSGFQCAPMAHEVLGTGDIGAIRASFGFFSTEKDLCRLISAIYDIKRQYLCT